ncbi:hypothetical protein A0H81_10059 [Grifola frondosa]|uniref:Eukaryotic glycogen debranching enzyme N-terminal domain-containing protein n=1 Tax=Grifola frondosa TaxID=5627 RepID=A0A1C7M3N8_GRIFR|nr:hypothetical protein A0H81_10059 [Grifola frondosa]
MRGQTYKKGIGLGGRSRAVLAQVDWLCNASLNSHPRDNRAFTQLFSLLVGLMGDSCREHYSAAEASVDAHDNIALRMLVGDSCREHYSAAEASVDAHDNIALRMLVGDSCREHYSAAEASVDAHDNIALRMLVGDSCREHYSAAEASVDAHDNIAFPPLLEVAVALMKAGRKPLVMAPRVLLAPRHPYSFSIMPKAHKVRPALHSVTGPKAAPIGPPSGDSSSPKTPKTPKAPADEGIDFFEATFKQGEKPICVYELRTYVFRRHIPHMSCVSLEAGTPASKNGVFKANFPLDGGRFLRDRFVERMLPTSFSKPIQVDLSISHASAFGYWVEYDGANPGSRIKGREGYFNIDPILRTKSYISIFSFRREEKARVLNLSGISSSTSCRCFLEGKRTWEQMELDTATIEYSASVQSAGLHTVVTSEQDIAALIGSFQAAVKEALDKQEVITWSGQDATRKAVVQLAEIVRASGDAKGPGKLERKFGTHVFGAAAGFVKEYR